jgi:hypothetical protein
MESKRFVQEKLASYADGEWYRPGAYPPALQPTLAVRALIIEAPWLVNGGHGASLRHHSRALAVIHIAAARASAGGWGRDD